MPILRILIAWWCAKYPPEGNFIPQRYKDHSMLAVASVKILCVVGFFATGSNIWTWLIWLPIFMIFNTDDFYKVYEEYWEIRLKKKLTLTGAMGRIINLWVDDKLKKIEERGRKK
jgi:hypothetical protein